MAAGSMVAPAAGGRQDYPGGLTLFVSMACLVAATGGLLFGYDIGVSGGVMSMDPFLVRFFPSVYRKQQEAAADRGGNQYCMFDSQLLTTFTSSIFLSALAASRGASGPCSAAAPFSSPAAQSAPLYLSEMAPARMRGMLNNGFNLMITVGILLATLVNYGTQKIAGGWGWRLSLALAAVLATVIVVGSFFLHDTPNSLLERGHPEEAKRMLPGADFEENLREDTPQNTSKTTKLTKLLYGEI
nr:unnamed protein product [Digitaria exilis]